MSPKRILSVILLIFAVGSAAYVLVSEPSPVEPVAAIATDSTAAPELIVYYMDMGKDCTTCLNLETFTLEALEAGFAQELADGDIEWRVVDLDVPENEHFIKAFRLYTKSVVLVDPKSANSTRYESLSRIWELVYDKDAFQAYIKSEVRSFLDAREAGAQ